jgi:hypothetical protein
LCFRFFLVVSTVKTFEHGGITVNNKYNKYLKPVWRKLKNRKKRSRFSRRIATEDDDAHDTSDNYFKLQRTSFNKQASMNQLQRTSSRNPSLGWDCAIALLSYYLSLGERFFRWCPNDDPCRSETEVQYSRRRGDSSLSSSKIVSPMNFPSLAVSC